MNHFDYIISGMGLSGLMLAYQMAKDPFFDDKSILLLDHSTNKQNDRTWSFWEESTGNWDDIVTSKWDAIEVKSSNDSLNLPIAPYQYKTIRSNDFYNKVWKVLKTKSNIEFRKEKVLNISHRKLNGSILTDEREYYAAKIFNSVQLNQNYWQQLKYPCLYQHFLGWFIETEEDFFHEDVATFMDFSIEQNNLTRFIYVLPFSKRKALVEYTLFSEQVFKESFYETELVKFLDKKNISYKVVEKEFGVIPMTSYKFWKHNSKHVLNMGTIGGWTKASTGFTFKNTEKQVSRVIEYLKEDALFGNFKLKDKYWFYDLIFLDVLTKRNDIGAKIFYQLFKKNKIQQVFKFLDEETSFKEEIKLFFSLPKFLFITSFFKYFTTIFKRK